MAGLIIHLTLLLVDERIMTQKIRNLRNINSKGRKITGKFFPLTGNVLNSSEFISLSMKAIKLLIDIGSSYNGNNNGDLAVTWSLMKKRGWKSRQTLGNAQKELESNFWILRTRQGGRNQCNLFAITWLPINYCNGKLDPGFKEDAKPLNWWNEKIRSGDTKFIAYK